jgi:hypothetical protein
MYPDVPIDPQLRMYIEKMQAIQKEMEEQLIHLDATWMVGNSSITIGHSTDSRSTATSK